MKLIQIFFVMYLSVTMMFARYHDIFTSAQLEKQLDKYEYSIVCCVDKKADLELFENIKNRLIAASNHDNFKEILKNKVGFLMVNVSSSVVRESLQKYEITQFPAILLFENNNLRYKIVQEPETASFIINLLHQVFGDQLKQLRAAYLEQHSETLKKTQPSYAINGASPYEWMPYSQYPYSRWGVRPYGYGYTFDAMVN